MAACPTHALPEWSATALQMDPGTVVLAQQVSVEMVPYVMTWMRCKFCSVSLFRWFEFLYMLSTFTFHSFLVWHGVWCLLQSQRKAALRQHRSRFPLSTLSQALQGQPAFWHGCGGCQEKQTGEPNTEKMSDWMHLTLQRWRKRRVDSYNWFVFISHLSKAVSKLHVAIPIFCCLRRNYI